MCNAFALRRPVEELAQTFGFPERPNLPPRTIVRPTNTLPVVALGQDGARHLVSMRWGLVPFWAKDLKTGLTMTNARAETLAEKPAFREPFRKGRRALVPLDGFFEWSGAKGAKQPHYFRPRDGRVLAFAGLWEQWRGPRDAPLEAPVLSFTFATIPGAGCVAPIHDRMPVLLWHPDQWSAWLDRATPEADLLALLTCPPEDLLETYPVRRDLLKVEDPGPEYLLPLETLTA